MRVRAIVENMLVGLVILNEQGTIEQTNPRIDEIFPDQAKLSGRKNIMSLFPELDRSEPAKFMVNLLQKSMGRIAELEVMRASGEIFPIELSLTEFQAKEGKRLMANILDVSERREVEKLKRDFVATVSHELRTPLTSIRGSLTLLNVGALGQFPDAGEKSNRHRRA